ncbi:MAG: Panacea domain-containing protein [Prevotella sp.]|nr:Panacea domain-containing protein [Prevotella sp.]
MNRQYDISGFDRLRAGTIVETALYILNSAGALDRYHLCKVMYFAERAYIAKWGSPMTDEVYCALKYGPVPSHLYDAIKDDQNNISEFARYIAYLFWDAVSKGDEKDDTQGLLFPKRKADTSYLSKAAIEALDEAVSKYAGESFNTLKNISHNGIDWRNAWKKTGLKVLSILDMAESGNASKGILELISDGEEPAFC